ncbi:Putative thioesterase, alpha/Beta hydrolase [Colletotrichum destructivum]|uniref:Thioesterase, alpha/Beta hydrolase n=1 Tax=Colletotrichum destructivum TaxID=34406 RepID=A0AAX4J317_9PEZI|nr:Putative thioesterase, alpha/Beta hydrolase [Colletotrichum destructivum]
MLNHPIPKECEVIQPASPRGQTQTPLFLIHDGGGTTFAYHCLSPLDRAVFGIANPRFHSGVPWDGGLPEMAAAYIQMIRNTVTKSPEYPALAPFSPSPSSTSPLPVAGRGGKTTTTTTTTRRRRRILLGGWSLGGLLSLEIARQLGDEDEDLEIVGLVAVDSVYPVWPEGSRVKVGRFIDELEPEAKNLKLARRAMKLAGGMVRAWKMPRCGAAVSAAIGSVADPEAAAAVAAGDEATEKDFYSSKADKETAEVVWERPPRAVLVKAKEHVPLSADGISSVDVWRGDRKLGWDGYCPGFVVTVLETEGNHFDMFSWGYIEGITEKIAEACRILERRW